MTQDSERSENEPTIRADLFSCPTSPSISPWHPFHYHMFMPSVNLTLQFGPALFFFLLTLFHFLTQKNIDCPGFHVLCGSDTLEVGYLMISDSIYLSLIQATFNHHPLLLEFSSLLIYHSSTFCQHNTHHKSYSACFFAFSLQTYSN